MIDQTLKMRGHLHLIHGQPLRLVEKNKSRPSGSAKVVVPNTLNAPQAQSSFSRFKLEPRALRRDELRYNDVPSSSTSSRGVPTETPTLPKRLSEIPRRAPKKQKTSHPSCPIGGGPPHILIDCPITAEGPQRYCP